MATTLKAFQQEISSISDQKKAEHLRELRQAQQQTVQGHGHGKSASSANKMSGAAVKLKTGKDKDKEKERMGKAEEVKAVAGEVKEKKGGEEEDAVLDVPDVSIEDLLHDTISPTPTSSDPDPLQAKLGSLLVLQHGELILSLGHRPSANALFGPESGAAGNGPPHPSTEPGSGSPTKSKSSAASNGDSAGWIGRPVDKDSLEKMLSRLRSTAEKFQAVLTQLYIHNEDDPPVPTISTPSNSPTTTSTDIFRQAKGPYGSWMIRIKPARAEEIIEVRCAVVGNVDSGKSTLTGVLTRGGLDDGRGKTRVALFRHKHELETGRTSSVGLEILGFSPQCDPVVPTGHAAANLDASTAGSTVAKREKIAWDEVCSKAAKVVSFIDLAGHERYLKTTLFGLTGCSPDYVCLIIGGNAGLIGMSKEHLGVSLALQVPIIICVTKIDMTPAHVLEQTVKQLVKVLKSPGCRKIPVFVESMEQAVNCASYLHSERITPIFMMSNVTGAGLPQLKTLLNCLPTSQGGTKYLTDAPLEFSISDVFSVPFAGSVASGIVVSGKVKVGDNVLLGPDSLGQFIPTSIKSIQKKRVDVETAEAGQSVSFALKKVRRSQLRKGMVILAKQEPLPKAIRRFEAQMLVLYHNTTIQPRYQAMCHINSVRQTVKIVSIDHPTGVLRTGDRAKVIFEFIQAPEYISAGAKVLVREARCRLLGVVTDVNR